MRLSKEQQTKLRKFVPLVVLYPLSAGIGVISTIYVAKEINRSYPMSNTSSNSQIEQESTTTTSITPSTISKNQLIEQQKIADLKGQIARLESQIQKLVGSTGAPGPNQSSAQSTPQTPPPSRPPLISPKPVVTAPPPTHASTGASRALR